MAVILSALAGVGTGVYAIGQSAFWLGQLSGDSKRHDTDINRLDSDIRELRDDLKQVPRIHAGKVADVGRTKWSLPTPTRRTGI